MANTISPNGGRGRTQRVKIEQPVTVEVTFNNHVDWATMRDEQPVAKLGNWAYHPGFRALRALVASRHGVTIDPAVLLDVRGYGRKARVSGKQADLDAMLAEYNGLVAKIIAKARITYLAAAEAERQGDLAKVGQLNPGYVASWEPFHNAYLLGAVAALAEGSEVRVPSARCPHTAHEGRKAFSPQVEPVKPERTKRPRKTAQAKSEEVAAEATSSPDQQPAPEEVLA